MRKKNSLSSTNEKTRFYSDSLCEFPADQHIDVTKKNVRFSTATTYTHRFICWIDTVLEFEPVSVDSSSALEPTAAWPGNGNDSPPLRFSLFVWIVGVPARQTPVKLVSLELDECCTIYAVNNAGCMAFRHNQSQTSRSGGRKSSSSRILLIFRWSSSGLDFNSSD